VIDQLSVIYLLFSDNIALSLRTCILYFVSHQSLQLSDNTPIN